jgi:uncharacterized alpha-E superfamily protein
MVRDVGWCFMDAGRRLERGIQLLSLLHATVPETRGTATDSLVLESVLAAAESIITYRYRYRSHAQLETMLDLMLLDGGNPRSLAFQLARLTEDLDALPAAPGIRLRVEQRLVLEASTMLRLADVGKLVAEQAHERRPALGALLRALLDLLTQIGEAVDAEHFVHLTPTYSLVGPAGSEPTIGKAA